MRVYGTFEALLFTADLIGLAKLVALKASLPDASINLCSRFPRIFKNEAKYVEIST